MHRPSVFLSGLAALLLLLASLPQDGSAQNMELVDNGYTGVLIAISDTVPETPGFIDNLKSLIDEMSEVMYKATRSRAYLKDVTILIPSTWNNSSSAQTATVQTFEKANIRIDNNGVDSSLAFPWVHQPLGCGEPGEYMVLPPSLVTNKQASIESLGPLGKALVHEWGHLRWGLFDEYQDWDDNKNQFYRSPSTDQVEPTRCNLNLNGLTVNRYNRRPCQPDPMNLLPEANCRLFPDSGLTTATASFMSYQYLDTISFFCDDDGENPLTRHNSEAPHQQNRLCGGRSAWSVMKENVDFANDANLPRYLEPTVNYKIVSHRNVAPRVVICMDTSGSMGGVKQNLLHDAVSYFILYTADYGTRIGLVSFSNFAITITSSLVEISDDAARTDVAGQVPNEGSGGTNIKDGLEAAWKILKDGNEGPSGGRIIMVTDGEDNLGWLDDTVPSLIADGVIVDTVLLTDDATNAMKILAERTGGTAYFERGSVLSSDLKQAFKISQKVQRGGNPFKESQLLYDSMIPISSQQQESVTIVVDSNLGLNSTFTFSWLEQDSVNITLIAPNGTVYLPSTAGLASSFKCSGICETGRWTVTAHYSGGQPSSDISIQLTSLPRPVQRESDGSVSLESIPITVSTSIANPEIDYSSGNSKPVSVFAVVTRGYSPVIGATVTATLQGASDSSEIRLLDSGAGADITKDDGTYSAYILNAESLGKHTISVKVVGGDQTSVRVNRVGSKAAVISSPGDKRNQPVEEVLIPTSDFQRQTLAGFIEVKSLPPPNTDTRAPSRVTDLQVVEASYELGQVSLSWTAVGDDLDQGTAASYELWQAGSYHTLLNRTDNATQVDNSSLLLGNFSSPSPAYSQENIIISVDRSLGVIVYGLVVRDDAGNPSQMSNIVSARMEFVDIKPPAKISDLKLVSSSFQDQTAALEWTAVGDDGFTDYASSYEMLKYTSDNGSAYNESSFWQDFVSLNETDFVSGGSRMSSPSPSNSTERVVIQLGTGSYSFAVVAVDEAGNTSPYSNIITIDLTFDANDGNPSMSPRSDTTQEYGDPSAAACTSSSLLGFIIGLCLCFSLLYF